MLTFELLRVAIRAIWANRFRSVLTILGMVIGVSAVITVMAVGRGGQQMIEGELLSMANVDAFFIFRDWRKDGENGVRTVLTTEDVEAVRLAFPQLQSVTASYDNPGWGKYKLSHKDKTANRIEVEGVRGDEFRLITPVQVKQGRFLTDEDDDFRSMIAVVDTVLQDELFGPELDPVGQEVQFGPFFLTVVGVKEAAKGVLSMMDRRGRLFIPRSVAMMIDDEPFRIETLVARHKGDKKAMIEAVTAFLKERHGGIGNYRTETMGDWVGTFNAITGVLSLILSLVAGISLLVGGIGIMNIMLVSVTERTREIGLRKAIGAQPRDILTQFLWEATVLSLIGGGMGIVLGLGGAAIGTEVVHHLLPHVPFVSPVSGGAILFAAGISVGIGIFFGFYPALRASRLNPVDALRFE